MADAEGEYIMLTANAEKELTDYETEIIKNWLKTESGLDKAMILIK